MFKRKNILAIIITLILCFVVTACGQKATVDNTQAVKSTAYPLKIVDSYNRTVTIEKEPQRIVSISPSITETVFALGKGDKLVGRSSYCDYPEQATKVSTVGDMMNPSIEKIVALKPDVVIVSNMFNKDTIKKLEDLKITVVVLYGKETFDGVYDNIGKVAEVINANEKAKTIVSDMKKKVSDVTTKVKSANKPSVYYVVSFGKSGDFTSGKDTFISNMIDMAGGKNAAGDVTGWQYSIEKLVQNNPDILICSKYFDAKKGIEAATGYKDLKSVKEGKLLEIDSNLLDRQGPRQADGLEALAKLIHPELFK